MAEQGKMKFIRKNGRVIPIRDKGGPSSGSKGKAGGTKASKATYARDTKALKGAKDQVKSGRRIGRAGAGFSAAGVATTLLSSSIKGRSIGFGMMLGGAALNKYGSIKRRKGVDKAMNEVGRQIFVQQVNKTRKSKK